jgi:hypothetical protein
LAPQSDPDEADPLLRDQPLLTTLYGASIQGRIATGPRAVHRVRTLAVHVEDENPAVPAGPRCASLSGISLHANVYIPAAARRQLEKLRRYVARPAV